LNSSSVPFQQAGQNERTPAKEAVDTSKSQGNTSDEMTQEHIPEEDEELAK
jgi:hypothetical protein